jgi:peptide/nickel transport system substrate-binding protein
MERRTCRTVVIGLVTLAVLALVACGGSGGENGSGGAGAGGGADDPAGDPVYGGSVTYALEAETSGGWCLPEAQLAIAGIQVARTVYDTLTTPDEAGAITPFLAESVEPNATFDQWTIRLREGVTFHDGTPLTAQVVKNNLDAYRGAYPGRTALLFLFVFQNVAAVEVVDELTVRVDTATPWPAFPWYLWSNGRVGIMAQSQLDDATSCDSVLVGTGPFRQEEWAVNERFVATRYEGYWVRDAAGEQLPYLDRIEYLPIAEGTSRVNTFESGEADIMHTVNANDIDALLSMGDDIDVLTSDEYADVAFQQLNVAPGKVFSNPLARRAVAHAIDREAFNEVRDLGQRTLASGPFAPGNMGHLEDTGYPDYDPDTAEELVEQYERETGDRFRISLLSASDAGSSQGADLLQRDLEAVGIEVDRRQVEQASAVDEALAGNFDLLQAGNHPGGDPDLQYVWWATGSPVNIGRIADPELQALLDEGRTTTDPARRELIYQDVNRRFAEQLYALWQAWPRWYIASWPDVAGVAGPQLPGGSGPFPGLAAGHSVAGIWRRG